jgi:hypothetical protein
MLLLNTLTLLTFFCYTIYMQAYAYNIKNSYVSTCIQIRMQLLNIKLKIR